jgi:hypothetical protein
MYKKYYRPDMEKTPGENIIEALKLIIPAELAISKLAGALIHKDSEVALDGVHLLAICGNKWEAAVETKYMSYVRVRVHPPHVNDYSRRRRGLKRSIKLYKGQICLTELEKVFTEYKGVFKKAKDAEEERIAEEQRKSRDVEEIYSKTRLPRNEVSFSYKDAQAYRRMSLELTDKQIEKLAPYLLEVLNGQR